MTTERLIDIARRFPAAAEQGQTLVEYALIVVFISIGTLGAFMFVKNQIADVFTQIATLLAP